MKVLISGASGLIGKALQKALNESGNEVFTLVRNRKEVSPNAIFWDPKNNLVDNALLEDFDAIVNLSGEGIAAGRWTVDRKKAILDSRIDSTKTLVDALIHLNHPPKVLINASAVGYYGDRGEEICTEETGSGSGFLADVCRQWEAVAMPAVQHGIRTVFLRFGVVLSADGGAFARMLPFFKLGVGGKLGSGEQYMSWISIDDLVGIIIFAINHENVRGPVNTVAPAPVKNSEFTDVLGKALNRPTVLTIPAFMLRFLLGNEMADEVLLGSTRAEPKQITQSGYLFKHPDLESAVNYLLDKDRKMVMENGTKSEKSFLATLLFCILLGTFGVHRFYVGKIGTGILMLITFGGFGIWWLIDLIMIIAMRFRDKKGLLIEP